MNDCVFTDCRDGIKIESSEGATFEDLAFSGIEMKDVNRPFYITATRFPYTMHSRSFRPSVGRIRNLRFRDLRATARRGDSARPFDRTCVAVVSLPGYAIEDIALTNVKFMFPGGGTAEQAKRMDVAEMLNCNDYMEWARPFDGELPSSVLYLRHLRGVRLENVQLIVERPDARPFIAGDDVDGFTLQDVVASCPRSGGHTGQAGRRAACHDTELSRQGCRSRTIAGRADRRGTKSAGRAAPTCGRP